MSLLEPIREIFDANTKYEQAHQLVNQAASLKYLSTDLYRDSKRFIYELLQNADDSSVGNSSVNVAIKIFDDKLVVTHNGKPFDARDIRGITGVDDGTKKKEEDKTGFKGIGFKAVFGQSDHVVVFSQGEYFRFDALEQHPWDKKWGESREAWEEKNDRKFEMPWQLIPIYTNASDIESPIRDFLSAQAATVATIVTLKRPADAKIGLTKLIEDVNMFLFLKNIESISVSYSHDVSIKITPEANNETSITVNGIEKARWLKRTITLSVPKKVTDKLEGDNDMPEKLRLATKVDITLAAKVTSEGLAALDNNERLLYAYLPTEETSYHISVLVNGPFYTVANRETLHKESPWNEWLFSCIPMELLKWIADLAKAKKYDAYNLLPGKLSQSDPMAVAYNTSMNEGIQSIPLVVNTDSHLLRVPEAIIDFTLLSEKEYVGRNAVRAFIIAEKKLQEIHQNPFVPSIGYASKLKKIGVAAFHWGQVPALLATPAYNAAHTAEHNRDLLHFLKATSHNDNIAEITDTILKEWPFILNHKGELKAPKEVFFPSEDDVVDASSSLSFINSDLQKLLDVDPETKVWLESLGVVEKTDITFLEKTIIPNAATYITPQNAIETIRKIFNLYSNGDIGNETLALLKHIKLLTTENTLITATDSFFSSFYRPRMIMEQVLKEDIYISADYVDDTVHITKWKAFFMQLGVNEGIDIITYEKRLSNATLSSIGVKSEYLTRPEHKFTFYNDYWVKEIAKLTTLTLLQYGEVNHSFAKVFWEDVITNIQPNALQIPATVYYGIHTKTSWINGASAENYLKWYVANVAALPNSTNNPLNAKKIFLNTDENRKIAGKYLPVFEGPELNADWRSFFNFTASLKLEDYLLLLSKLAEDPNGDNKNRTQSIYEALLDEYTNWDTAQQDLVTKWAETGLLADTDGIYRHTGELRYYADGDPAIFGGSYYFLSLGVNARRHTNIIELLKLFNVTVLRQNEFGIKASDDQKESSLKSKLQEILPYWAKWMETERQSGYEEMLLDLQLKLNLLEIKEASELSITYGEDWSLKVPLYYRENKLYVTSPWNSNKMMYVLPDKLCEVFPVKNYAKEIAFLIKADSNNEVEEYFMELGMGLPPAGSSTAIIEENSQQSGVTASASSTPPQKQPINYHQFWNASKERNKELVASCGNDPALVLQQGLQAQNQGNDVNVYHFSHIENAVSIIREGAIKSRQDAVFKDSAGADIINQTDATRQALARFYFRPKTPTQHYVENLGRGKDSIANLGNDPICPVPVFFIIPLVEAMEHCEWSISLGSMASPQVEFGNTIDIIERFDFDGVYKTVQELGSERFRLAGPQEFLAKDKLDLAQVNHKLVVQDEQAKECLLAMLGELATDYESRILVEHACYSNENPKVIISSSEDALNAKLSKEHGGYFVLQHSADAPWKEVNAQSSGQFKSADWVTIPAGMEITFKGDLENISYKLFYVYNGRIWLIHTNTEAYNFENNFTKEALQKWFTSSGSISDLFTSLKTHPELKYYFSLAIGGPDKLTLEEHTRSVIDNYLTYFKDTQKIFANENEYLLCLALHDIGKPVAVIGGNRHMQHSKTLDILTRIREVLPINEDVLFKMKTLINADPIGKYLNPLMDFTVDDAANAINEMSKKLEIPDGDFIQTLACYYQCDAAGYNSLRKLLFLQEANELIYLPDKARLLFNDEYEAKFEGLMNSLL